MPPQGSAYPPLGVPVLPSLMGSVFNGVYLFSQIGVHAPRDMVLNTVPNSGAPYKELVGGGGTGNGKLAPTGVEAGTG